MPPYLEASLSKAYGDLPQVSLPNLYQSVGAGEDVKTLFFPLGLSAPTLRSCLYLLSLSCPQVHNTAGDFCLGLPEPSDNSLQLC